MPQVLTAAADVDMQVAFDNGAALEGLSRVHRVNDLFITDLVTQAVTGNAEHAARHTGTKGSSGRVTTKATRTKQISHFQLIM